MTNKNQLVKIKELVKPQNNMEVKSQVEVESMCEGFTVSCQSGFSWSCSGKYESVPDDQDILF